MALALFDLDNTLLNGDSDHAWGLYLASVGAVDPLQQKQKQDYFYQQYKNGTLDIQEFLEYQLAPLAQFSLTQLKTWRSEFIDTVIKPMIETGKSDLIDKHRLQNDKIVIITATNDFITQPIANELGVDTLIATETEILNGKYTGKHKGIPCFQAGKIERLKQWLYTKQQSSGHEVAEVVDLKESYFYSDSINDLPLLELVGKPIAVTPDDKLRAHAKKSHWPIID